MQNVRGKVSSMLFFKFKDGFSPLTLFPMGVGHDRTIRFKMFAILFKTELRDWKPYDN